MESHGAHLSCHSPNHNGLIHYAGEELSFNSVQNGSRTLGTLSSCLLNSGALWFLISTATLLLPSQETDFMSTWSCLWLSQMATGTCAPLMFILPLAILFLGSTTELLQSLSLPERSTHLLWITGDWPSIISTPPSIASADATVSKPEP